MLPVKSLCHNVVTDVSLFGPIIHYLAFSIQPDSKSQIATSNGHSSPHPKAGFGKAQLEFSGVLANYKRQVLPAGQLKVRGENFFQGVESLDGLAVAHAAAEPIFARGIFGQ